MYGRTIAKEMNALTFQHNLSLKVLIEQVKG